METDIQTSALIERLATLGPEVQGNIDESLLVENLKLTPFERLIAAGEAAGQIEQLQRAMSVVVNA